MRLYPRDRSASQIAQARPPVFRLFIALVALQSPAAAQQITVLDAKCRSEIVSACYKRLEAYRINPGIDPCGGGRISNPGGTSCSEQGYILLEFVTGTEAEAMAMKAEIEAIGGMNVATMEL